MDHSDDVATYGSNGLGADPPPARAKLDTVIRVRRELAKVYREARAGTLDVADASKLANILQIMGRMIETSEIEARLTVLEAKSEGR
jgi:Trm5-related predicted tRNA methylase